MNLKMRVEPQGKWKEAVKGSKTRYDRNGASSSIGPFTDEFEQQPGPSTS